jgi:kynureninase
MNFQANSDSLAAAKTMDSSDPLSHLRGEFQFSHPLYFAGHSLGLMPKKVPKYLEEECEAWAKLGVEAHFEGRHPWLPYHENVTQSLARLVGARPEEVVAMNGLTVNLHLMMVSFYRPTKKRFKILIENNTFPSDRYTADSQARFHGFDPKDAVVELKPSPGKITLTAAEIEEQILECGDELALVLLGNCNYLSGQRFDFETITKLAHKTGAIAGFNLAHGAGNLELSLHDWSVDFAVWCSYKYLNAGPGGIAGAFVHENHLNRKDLPRFEGWWGHDKKTRFKMPADFKALPSVEAWQLSNPPIFQLASLRASLELFEKAGMKSLSERSSKLTSYLEWLLLRRLKDKVSIVTPQAPNRGSMLCLKFKKNPSNWIPKLREKGAVVDFREPDIVRATPAPLYTSFEDIFNFVQALEELTHE